MKQLLLLFLCLLHLGLAAQKAEDPALRKPFKMIVQTGLALQWFDTQFKSITLSAECPLNLYNHFGIQANFFFPNNGDGYLYRTITGDSYEIGVFSKSFFHGRLTGRRSNAYIGPDMRFGQRTYLDYGPFDGTLIERKSVTFKFLARMGWQFHMGPAILEFALPIGFESEKFKDEPISTTFYYFTNSAWFIAAPSLSLGIGF